MYASFFGFRELPFNVTPDPRFLYENECYREAVAALRYGIESRKGFIVLVGEAGTGKTTLLRRLLDTLEPTVRTVLLMHPTVSFDEILEHILQELGIPVDGGRKLTLLQRLNDFLIEHTAAGGNVALLIDEAQDLDPQVLEELRLLSNLETGREKILQIILAGQPELDGKLVDTSLRQLRQRVTLQIRLRQLQTSEVTSYVAARVAQVGGDARAVFDPEALARIAEVTQGIPRVVNVLCDASLLHAFATDSRRVTRRIVEEAWSDYSRGYDAMSTGVGFDRPRAAEPPPAAVAPPPAAAPAPAPEVAATEPAADPPVEAAPAASPVPDPAPPVPASVPPPAEPVRPVAPARAVAAAAAELAAPVEEPPPASRLGMAFRLSMAATIVVALGAGLATLARRDEPIAEPRPVATAPAGPRVAMVGAAKVLPPPAAATPDPVPTGEALHEPLTPTDARQLIDAYRAAYEQRDVAALQHLFAPDAIQNGVASRDAIVAEYRRAFDDMRGVQYQLDGTQVALRDWQTVVTAPFRIRFDGEEGPQELRGTGEWRVERRAGQPVIVAFSYQFDS